LLLATDIVEYLVSRGMAFRSAHELVGTIVRGLVAHGRDFADLSMAEWRAFSDVFDDGVREAISPRRSVMARRTPQSTAPDAVARALAETREWMTSHE
jgi:argininosuccinate lyase